MARLNAAASEAALRHGVRAATDVTGFGLAGHATGIARESGIRLELRTSELPLLPHARELAPDFQPGGLKANRSAYAPQMRLPPQLEPALEALLFDPQTSGGLLLLVPPGALEALTAELPEARVVGRALEPGPERLVCV
jgi:selenide,water dikinase